MSTPDPPRRARPPLRRLGTIAVAWLAVTGVALGIAIALDDPVGAGPRDTAPIIAGPVVEPGQELTGPLDLPPLSLVLNVELSESLLRLDLAARADRLRALAVTTANPDRLLELGTTRQELGELDAARAAYQDALRLDPGNLAAQAGLAVLEGSAGGEGLDRAAALLERLAARHPDDQLLAFNRGWVAVYQAQANDDPAARTQLVTRAIMEWQRTVALDARTPLGRLAAQLLEPVGSSADGGSGSGP